MKYAIVLASGITELREDNYDLPKGAVELTDDQYDQLCNGDFILQNGQVTINPTPLKRLLGDQSK